MNINDATIIHAPTINPKMPSLPCFGAILVLNSSAFSFAASFFDKKNLLIRPKPNIKPKVAETMFPAKSVIHQIGAVVNQPRLRIAVIIPHIPQKQKTSPIQPW